MVSEELLYYTVYKVYKKGHRTLNCCRRSIYRNNSFTVWKPGIQLLNGIVIVKFEEKSSKYESDKTCLSTNPIFFTVENVLKICWDLIPFANYNWQNFSLGCFLWQISDFSLKICYFDRLFHFIRICSIFRSVRQWNNDFCTLGNCSKDEWHYQGCQTACIN